MKKLLFISVIFACIGTYIFAQEAEDIELPEVTTVITGETVKVGLDSLPDFSDVMEQQTGSGYIVPVLPDVEISDQGNEVAVTDGAVDKSIYAEGQLGGGYPALFKGDFSVYRLDGLSPFRLNFSHNSAAGYAGKSLTEGYNHRDTLMSADRTLTKEKLEFNFGALYETMGRGLQNKVENISNVDNDLINAYAKLGWTLPYNFVIGGGLDAGFNDRYADITTITNCPIWIKDVMSYDVTPAIFANWSGYGFDVNFDGNFWFGGITPCEKTVYTRGDFGLDLAWTKDRVKLFGDVDVLFGNSFDEKAIAPFQLGVDTSFPVYFSNRKFAMLLKGGLDSQRNNIAALEKQFAFAAFDSMPEESSEWFGNVDFSVPLKSSVTCNLDVDFRKTAFDNGRYMPVYEGTPEYGLYSFQRQNVTMLATEFNFTYHYKLLSVAASWHSSWLDVPALEAPQLVLLDISVQSEESKWGVNLLGKFAFADNPELPVINMDCFFRVTPAVRIVFAAEDIIKLCAGKERTYAGQYVAQGGNASFLVKFFF